MYCSRCGTQNPDLEEVKFCRTCGTPLMQATSEPAPAGPPPFAPVAAGPVAGAAIPLSPTAMAAVFPYGGFWIRFVAYLIDSVILAVVGGILGVLTGIYSVVVGMDEETVGVLLTVVGTLIGYLYFIILPPTVGGSLGKVVLGYNIVGQDGRRIGYGRAFGRELSQTISAIALCLGFIWIGIDANKQGWHDKIAGTFVVRKEFVKR